MTLAQLIISIGTVLSSIATRLTNVKAALKAALEAKGVTVGNAPLSQYATLMGTISVGSNEGHGEYLPGDWRLVDELANHLPSAFPYAYIVKYSKFESVTNLTGANAYYTSDGAYYTANSAHTWNDANDGKSTRYVIYCFSSRIVDVIFATGQRGIVEVMLDDIQVGKISLQSTRICRFFCTSKTTMTQISADSSSAFYMSMIGIINLPITGVYSANTFSSCSALTCLSLPNLVEITASNFANSCVSLSSVTLPNLVTMASVAAFSSCASLSNIYLPILKVLTGTYCFQSSSALLETTYNSPLVGSTVNFNTDVYQGSSISTINLLPDSTGAKWSWSINFTSAPLTAAGILAIVNSLRNLSELSYPVRYVTLGSTNWAKVDAATKNIAINKGYICA